MRHAKVNHLHSLARKLRKMSTDELIEKTQQAIASYEAEHGPVPRADRLRPSEVLTEREIVAEYKLIIYLLPKLESGELFRELEEKAHD